MFINVNGTWKSISDIFLNVSGTWKRITRAFINVAGTWRELLIGGTLAPQNQVTISKSTNATTFLVTLTGTNYYWSPGPPVLTYKFQWSANSGSTWTNIDSGSITNPSFGSSNTKSYALSASAPNMYVTPNVLNLYRFVVDATYGSLSATSESSTVSVQGPTNISLSTTTLGGSSVGLSWTASTGAGAYLVYYSTDNSTYILHSTVLAGTTTATVSGLSGTGTLYYFKVLPITGTSNTYKGYSGNFSNTVSANLATYTVSFNGNGGTSGTTQTIPAGTSLSLPSSSRDGFTFNGWYTSFSGGTFIGFAGTSYTPTSSITLYAQWTVIQYTVTWNANGGSVTPSSNTVSAGGSVTAPTPTRSGFTFLYWRDTPSGDFLYSVNAGASFTPPSSITMYARWTVTPIIPTITMAANSGVTATTGTINWTSTNQISFSANGAFSADGATATSISKTGLSAVTTYTGTVTVYSSTGHSASANYSLTTVQAQYTVTWNANGGSGGGTTGPFDAGILHTAPSPGTRSGFTFLYWRDSPSGDFLYSVNNGGTFNPPSNITMYARWGAVTPSISRIVARNGGTGGAYKMRYTITATNTTSYTIRIRYGSTTSTVNSFNNTVSSSVIQTNLGNVINDYYILEITPWSGSGGTGSAGTQRTTTIKRNTSTPTDTTNNY